jgi:hypothetical protein
MGRTPLFKVPVGHDEGGSSDRGCKHDGDCTFVRLIASDGAAGLEGGKREKRGVWYMRSEDDE